LKALGETFYRRLLLLEAATESLSEPPPATQSLEFAFLAPSGPASTRSAKSVPRLPPSDCGGATAASASVVTGGSSPFAWIAFEEAPVAYLGCRLLLAPGVAYLYDTYTAPSARGGGISSSTWLALARQLSTEGFQTILAAVLPENRAARRAMAKLPYRVIGKAG
jgi:GNAT superfamily N-acetyltransferase